MCVSTEQHQSSEYIALYSRIFQGRGNISSIPAFEGGIFHDSLWIYQEHVNILGVKFSQMELDSQN